MGTYADIQEILAEHDSHRGVGRRMFGTERKEITSIRNLIDRYPQSAYINESVWRSIKEIAQEASGQIDGEPISSAIFSLKGATPNTANTLIKLFQLYCEDSDKDIDSIKEAETWFGIKFANELRLSRLTKAKRRRSTLVQSALYPAREAALSEPELLRRMHEDLLSMLEIFSPDQLFEYLGTFIPTLEHPELILSRQRQIQGIINHTTKPRETDGIMQNLVRHIVKGADYSTKLPFIEPEHRRPDSVESLSSRTMSESGSGSDSDTSSSSDSSLETEPSTTIYIANNGTDAMTEILANIISDGSGHAFLSDHVISENPYTGHSPVQLYRLLDAGLDVPKHTGLASRTEDRRDSGAVIDMPRLELCVGLMRIQDPALMTILSEDWFETSYLQKLARVPAMYTTQQYFPLLQKLNPTQLTEQILKQLAVLSEAKVELSSLNASWISKPGLSVIQQLNTSLRAPAMISALNNISPRYAAAYITIINDFADHGLFGDVSPDVFFRQFQRLLEHKCPRFYLNTEAMIALSSIHPSKITKQFVQRLRQLEKDEIFTREAAKIPYNTKVLSVIFQALADEELPPENIFDTPKYHCIEMNPQHLRHNLMLNLEAVMPRKLTPEEAEELARVKALEQASKHTAFLEYKKRSVLSKAGRSPINRQPTLPAMS